MLELLELIFGTADSLGDILSDNDEKPNGKRKIPLWLRVLFFILIYCSALFIGIVGGYDALQGSHILTAIAYWLFAACLLGFIVYIIIKATRTRYKKALINRSRGEGKID